MKIHRRLILNFMKKVLTLAALACAFAYLTPSVNAASIQGHKHKHHKHAHHSSHARKHHHKSRV